MRIDNRVFESYTVEFNSPLTDEDWEKLEDVDFDHTEHIWFHTKNGKEVHFYKNAISIEWIKEYASMKSFNDEMDCYWHFWEDDVLKMVDEWEKENETN